MKEMGDELKDKLQLSLRKDGKIPIICVEADNLAEATHKAIIACHDSGARIETPKQQEKMTLGYDANMLIEVKNPDSDPKIYFPGIQDGMQNQINQNWREFCNLKDATIFRSCYCNMLV